MASPPATFTPPRPRQQKADLQQAGESVAILVVAGLGLLAADALLGIGPTGPAGIALVAVGAVLARRHPVAAVLGIFLLTGFIGSLLAFTSLNPRPAADFLLLSLWIAVVWSFLAGRQRPVWLWPALLAPALYLAVSAIGVLSADSLSTGLDSFRLSSWMLSAIFVVALAPWSDETRIWMARAALIAGALVSGYCLFRWFAGPAIEESQVAREAFADLPASTEIRFFGSFIRAQDLAMWFGTLLPFALGIALGFGGRWRLLAAAVIGVGAFLVVATEVRTGLVAMVAGVVLTLLLFQLATAFPGGVRLGTSVVAGIVVAVVGIGGFTLAVGESDESTDRFSRILTPGEDPTFSNRLERWEDAWPEVTAEPFGHGLGRAGQLSTQGAFVPTTHVNLDSSYLKIGLEQGPIVMVGFIVAMLALLVGLARRSISVRDPARAAVGLGACGTLLALLVFFFAGFYIENPMTLAASILVGLGVAGFTGPPTGRAA